MTTMQKFKAYFGMVPPSEYEDDYLADSAELSGEERAMTARERAYLERYRGAGREEPYYQDEGYELDYEQAQFEQEGAYAEAQFAAVQVRGGYADDRGYGTRLERPAERAAVPAVRRAPVVAESTRPRLEPLNRSANVTVRGATALAPEPRVEASYESAGRISTLRPADYSQARTIGERFRSGNPVIMDLVDMSNDDAKRLVDFAAGLAFALRGSLEKVATKVFLLSPAGIDVSPEERRRAVETGFTNQS
ncbi:cell division protein SepF [Gordonia sp. VNK21]|uniref:cell division protein SepF n=1 Tax=Gordonia sp. VNK21 TaxID=3382483 RepID=UPI0038D3538C